MVFEFVHNCLMSEFVIRSGEPLDGAKLAPILAEILGRNDLEDEVIEGLNTNLLRLFQTPGATLIVAENEQGLLGFASIWTRWGVFDENPSGIIDRIVVKPSYETTAVPHALLEQAIGACQGMGCGNIDVILSAESTLLEDSLAKFGFEQQGKRYFLEIL